MNQKAEADYEDAREEDEGGGFVVPWCWGGWDGVGWYQHGGRFGCSDRDGEECCFRTDCGRHT